MCERGNFIADLRVGERGDIIADLRVDERGDIIADLRVEHFVDSADRGHNVTAIDA